MNAPPRPAIFLSAGDAARLRRVAAKGCGDQAAELLAEELARATVCPPDEMPARVVRIGSRVRYREDSAEADRVVRVVMPEDAAPERGAVSILDLAGAALIGVPEEVAFRWLDREGRLRQVEVIQVLDDFIWK